MMADFIAHSTYMMEGKAMAGVSRAFPGGLESVDGGFRRGCFV